MTLYLSTTSPYARLALLAALRGGRDGLRLEFVKPWENPEKLTTVNPYSQIPALVTDSGLVLTETLIIMHHLDPHVLAGGRDDALLGYAIATINQAVRYFSLKIYSAENSAMMQRSIAALQKALPKAPVLDAQSAAWGQIALGVALLYVRSRLPEIYAQYVSAENQAAVERFATRAEIQATATEALEKLPKTVADVRN